MARAEKKILEFLFHLKLKKLKLGYLGFLVNARVNAVNAFVNRFYIPIGIATPENKKSPHGGRLFVVARALFTAAETAYKFGLLGTCKACLW